MIRKLTPRDYAVSSWSGGTTTQLAIWPPEARYADRDFLWRVSSATVDLEESDFTPLPDYDRLISTLEGEIELSHNGGEAIRLRPFEVHAFSGADATHSRGRCRDFNLMLRRGRVTGSMELLRLTENPTTLNVICRAGNLPAKPTYSLLYCIEGEAKVTPFCHSERSASGAEESVSLAPGEALLLTETTPVNISGPSVVILCRIEEI